MTVSSEQADSADIFSDFFEHQVELYSTPPEGLALEFAAGTLAGKHTSTTEIPIASADQIFV